MEFFFEAHKITRFTIYNTGFFMEGEYGGGYFSLCLIVFQLEDEL